MLILKINFIKINDHDYLYIVYTELGMQVQQESFHLNEFMCNCPHNS